MQIEMGRILGKHLNTTCLLGGGVSVNTRSMHCCSGEMCLILVIDAALRNQKRLPAFFVKILMIELAVGIF